MVDTYPFGCLASTPPYLGRSPLHNSSWEAEPQVFYSWRSLTPPIRQSHLGLGNLRGWWEHRDRLGFNPRGSTQIWWHQGWQQQWQLWWLSLSWASCVMAECGSPTIPQPGHSLVTHWASNKFLWSGSLSIACWQLTSICASSQSPHPQTPRPHRP